MYLSMGNVADNPHVGLLFIDFEAQRRMRVNGTASINPDDNLLAAYPEAQFVVRVTATEIFPNCPRYIHKMELVERSRFVPHAGVETPEPEWKSADWARDVVPEKGTVPTVRRRTEGTVPAVRLNRDGALRGAADELGVLGQHAADVGVRRRLVGREALGDHVVAEVDVDALGVDVDRDGVAVVDRGDRAAADRLGREVAGHEAVRRAAEAPVGEQDDVLAEARRR